MGFCMKADMTILGKVSKLINLPGQTVGVFFHSELILYLILLGVSGDGINVDLEFIVSMLLKCLYIK